MAGTKAGGAKLKQTLLAKYGPDYHKQIGSLGGSVNRPESRLFYMNRDIARKAGSISRNNSQGKTDGGS